MTTTNFYIRVGVLMLFIVAVLNIGAKPRTQRQMQTAAQRVINANFGKQANKAPRKDAPMLLQQRNSVAVLGYSEGGYAIVSTDDLLPEVLGYADTRFEADSKNAGFNWWMKAIEEVADDVIKKGIRRKEQVFDTRVDPLLTTKWGQMEPYNNDCPTGTTSGDDWQNFENAGKCVTGCVATALAQILYYHRFPVSGTGAASVEVLQATGEKIVDTVNFSEGIYDWANMKDDYTQPYTEVEGAAVAKLMHHVGVASNMNYATDGSGAATYYAYYGLVEHFGFSEDNLGGISRDYLSYYGLTDQDWIDQVYFELDNRRPIYYTGYDEVGGHAFVLDGYDETGLVHVNWGWNGRDDGYFNLDLLDPETYKFSRGQDMIYNLASPVASEVEPIEVETEAGGLSDIIEVADNAYYQSLKINGEINSSDLKLIRHMAGRDEKGYSTGCRLYSLDLSEARIVSGGEPYLIADGQEYTTADDELPYKAFYNCRSLEQLSLPQLKEIHTGAWALTSLKSLNLTNEEGDGFKYVDGLLYSADGKRLISIVPFKEGEIEISNTVSEIEAYAIAGCHHLTRLDLPDALSKIGEKGIFDCGNLKVVTSPTLEPASAGDQCFMGLGKDCTLYYPYGHREDYENALWWYLFFVSENMKYAEMENVEPNAITLQTAVENSSGDVYTIDGKATGKTMKTINGLPAGVYIVKSKTDGTARLVTVGK